MTVMTKHEPGTFSWADLGTPDVAAAKKFYTALFGWSYRDDPMGPGEFYSRALLGGHDVCALYPQRDQQKQLGVPPHWSAYITVTSADDVAKQVKAAGGTVVMEPFDVFDAGRMLFLEDPSGGTIAGWEPRKHIGAGVMFQPGALCWAELDTTNVDAAGKFYTALGWKAETNDVGTGPYTVFKAGDVATAGMMAMPPPMQAQGIPSTWSVYFAVADCDATIATAKTNGGSVAVPSTNIPTVGRFAFLLDPQGIAFGILQPAM